MIVESQTPESQIQRGRTQKTRIQESQIQKSQTQSSQTQSSQTQSSQTQSSQTQNSLMDSRAQERQVDKMSQTRVTEMKNQDIDCEGYSKAPSTSSHHVDNSSGQQPAGISGGWIVTTQYIAGPTPGIGMTLSTDSTASLATKTLDTGIASTVSRNRRTRSRRR